MQFEVGSVVDGKVTGITNFGAFVEIAEGKTGMVHISEVSNSYVKEINEFLTRDQDVKVKVLSVADDGKISLSIKQCEEQPPREVREPREAVVQRRPPQPRRQSSATVVWQPKRQDDMSDLSFEDMMSKFKQVSNDRMGDLKRANEPKRSRRSAAK